MQTPTIHEGLGGLTDEECYRHLRDTKLGRVAVSVDALPRVFPVHYALLGRDPVFRTDEGTKLIAASGRNVVCFEIDHVNQEEHTGWSVMVIGPAEVITGAAELVRARALPLRPWVGRGEAYVRVSAILVSGRSVVHVPTGKAAPHE